MDMRMNFELLTPGVQHAEEADLCAEVSRDRERLREGFRHWCETGDRRGPSCSADTNGAKRRGSVKTTWSVARRQKFRRRAVDPPFPSSGLTLWAMAIAAAVIRDGGTMSAAGALVDMTAECGGTTPRNGPQHFDMLPAEPVAVSFDESISRSADEIGHLQRRPAHLLLAVMARRSAAASPKDSRWR